jgi:hypothetical protein
MATDEDLLRIFGPEKLLIGVPVRPAPAEQPPPQEDERKGGDER